MMNKPAGYLSATEDVRAKTVTDPAAGEYRRLGLFCAGRAGQGFRGAFIADKRRRFRHSIISPKKDIKKEYYIEHIKQLNPGAAEMFAQA
jgi:16S rRNA pseudouridine516 synthase